MPVDQHGNDHLAPALGQPPGELALRRNAAGQSGQLLGGLVGVRDGDDIGDGRAIDWREQQTFAVNVAKGRPPHVKHFIALPAPTGGRLARGGDHFQFHRTDPRVAHAQDVRQPLPVGGDGLFIGRRGGKIPVPELRAPRHGFIRLAQQEPVGPRHEIGGDVSCHRQRRGARQRFVRRGAQRQRSAQHCQQ